MCNYNVRRDDFTGNSCEDGEQGQRKSVYCGFEFELDGGSRFG